MKKDLPFKIILVIIILISCALLSVAGPVLYKILIVEDLTESLNRSGIKVNLNTIYFGIGAGALISVFSLLRMDSEKQMKIARFLLILGTMLSAITYVLSKSSF